LQAELQEQELEQELQAELQELELEQELPERREQEQRLVEPVELWQVLPR
jgi:hypothetical protein